MYTTPKVTSRIMDDALLMKKQDKSIEILPLDNENDLKDGRGYVFKSKEERLISTHAPSKNAMTFIKALIDKYQESHYQGDFNIGTIDKDGLLAEWIALIQYIETQNLVIESLKLETFINKMRVSGVDSAQILKAYEHVLAAKDGSFKLVRKTELNKNKNKEIMDFLIGMTESDEKIFERTNTYPSNNTLLDHAASSTILNKNFLIITQNKIASKASTPEWFYKDDKAYIQAQNDSDILDNMMWRMLAKKFLNNEEILEISANIDTLDFNREVALRAQFDKAINASIKANYSKGQNKDEFKQKIEAIYDEVYQSKSFQNLNNCFNRPLTEEEWEENKIRNTADAVLSLYESRGDKIIPFLKMGGIKTGDEVGAAKAIKDARDHKHFINPICQQGNGGFPTPNATQSEIEKIQAKALFDYAKKQLSNHPDASLFAFDIKEWSKGTGHGHTFKAVAEQMLSMSRDALLKIEFEDLMKMVHVAEAVALDVGLDQKNEIEIALLRLKIKPTEALISSIFNHANALNEGALKEQFSVSNIVQGIFVLLNMKGIDSSDMIQEYLSQEADIVNSEIAVCANLKKLKLSINEMNFDKMLEAMDGYDTFSPDLHQLASKISKHYGYDPKVEENAIYVKFIEKKLQNDVDITGDLMNLCENAVRFLKAKNKNIDLNNIEISILLIGPMKKIKLENDQLNQKLQKLDDSNFSSSHMKNYSDIRNGKNSKKSDAIYKMN